MARVGHSLDPSRPELRVCACEIESCHEMVAAVRSWSRCKPCDTTICHS